MKELDNIEKAVDQILEKLGDNIVLGTPLGIGKANNLLNALYKRAKKNKKINLTICTALTLEIPKGKSLLEKRFLDLFVPRVFGDYPDLEYELDRTKKKLPKNIRVIEFYFAPGKYLNDPQSQQDYISSNYTHVCRDMMDRGINLLVQLVSRKDQMCSFSCNADVSSDMIPIMRKRDYPTIIVAEVNQNLPFMFGDAAVKEETFDIVVDIPDNYFKLFGPPKLSISDVDYMIGLHASTLVKDDGELQVGIGSLGDAVIYGLILRHNNNGLYRKLLTDTGFLNNFQKVIIDIGDLRKFKIGLFGATEMMVDGFMELYKHDILKKKVYDHIGLQRLINEGQLNPNELSEDIFEKLIQKSIINTKLTVDDFSFLTYWGILKENLSYDQIKDQELKEFRGEKLLHGHLMHAGFFLGPTNFYQWLKDLPEVERKLFVMKSVLKTNQLYGHEAIDRLHRKNARFINTCMMTTLSGAHVSDGLANGRLVSGVGGQYNFVSMAQELPDGHSVLTMRSTRYKKGKVQSNFVFNYGHITVPRHMRDILVTEYGVAFLRGKTDEEVIMELLHICDSRFQKELMNQCKKVGKLKKGYKIPKEFQNNLPANYQKVLSDLKNEKFFPAFPFGTDLTEDEIKVGGALKRLKAQTEAGKISTIKLLVKAFKTLVKDDQKKYLALLKLDKPKGLKEKILQKLVCTELH